MDKLDILKQYFGYDGFRPGQETIVDAILSGRDVLAVMPTGAGKSVCYQTPAMLLDGVTVVVSPLISLMKDQVSSLVSAGVPAAYLNSSLTYGQYVTAMRRMGAGRYKIVYVAPERLLNPAFLDICGHVGVPFVAVDEAHCVSQWGQDFRPDYLKIAEFIKSLPRRPVVGAFTATATDKVRADIENLLDLRHPTTVTTGFDRPNLSFSVLAPESKSAQLLKLLSERPGQSGIIYCSTRKTVEEVCAMLCERGYPAVRYHAGLEPEERRANQESFVTDESPIIVATNAFGMGIDKSNVSFVIHYNMPKNIESYYQEAGRAGRDGMSADCILLYSPRDIVTNKFLIENSEPNPELTEAEQAEVRRAELDRLHAMTRYATGTGCLRAYILRYFGEDAPDTCGNCSNCLAERSETVADVTSDAIRVLICVSETGQRFGITLISEILKGSDTERISRLRLDTQNSYGALSARTLVHIRAVIDALLSLDCLAVTDSEYPTLKLTARSRSVLRGETRVTIRVKAKPAKKASGSGAAGAVKGGLLGELKSLRSRLAREEHVPAYVIFTDSALADMCERMPRSESEFLQVSGVGKRKCEKYGEVFLDVIGKYM